MSEEHVEDVIEGMLRQSLAAGSQLAEQLVRARQQYMRNVEQRSEQDAGEAQRAIAADRATMQAVIMPATRDDWWETAQPDQITQAHILAEAWKDHDPAALAASEKISLEVKTRYGIDTVDLQGDAEYLQDHLAAQQLMNGTLQRETGAPESYTTKFYSSSLENDVPLTREISKAEALSLIASTPADQKRDTGWHDVDDIREWVGKDTEVDQAIEAKFPDLLETAEQRKAAAKEHAEAMALIEAAQDAQIKHYATELNDEMKRHMVPPAYLANDEMVAALQASKEAAGTDSAPEAERAVAERAHLIAKDGISGPSIDDLRKEIGENYSGTEDSMFADAGFVGAARDWHEAKTLAEGGFVDKGNTGLEARYENAEKELFARIAPMGQEIQDKVLKDPNTKAPALTEKEEEPTAPAYGSKEHYEVFESSLEGKATEAEIKGRVAAAKGQASHPFKAVKAPKKPPKARKATASVGMGRDKSPDGPTR